MNSEKYQKIYYLIPNASKYIYSFKKYYLYYTIMENQLVTSYKSLIFSNYKFFSNIIRFAISLRVFLETATKFLNNEFEYMSYKNM